tara:strand:+ start:1511 stop:2029 length:519 start_codon:yes stop_codon:yes gene_type:complete
MTNIQYLTQQVDIQEFKTRFYKKHGVSLHILTEEQTGFKLSLEVLHNCVIRALHANEPEFRYIKSLHVQLRRREYLVYTQLMAFFAFKEGHRKSTIGNSIGRNHATIIWSIKTIENNFVQKDALTINAHCNITKQIREYVGNLPENIKEQTDTKSGLSSIWNKTEDSSTVKN